MPVILLFSERHWFSCPSTHRRMGCPSSCLHVDLTPLVLFTGWIHGCHLLPFIIWDGVCLLDLWSLGGRHGLSSCGGDPPSRLSTHVDPPSLGFVHPSNQLPKLHPVQKGIGFQWNRKDLGTVRPFDRVRKGGRIPDVHGIDELCEKRRAHHTHQEAHVRSRIRGKWTGAKLGERMAFEL